LVPRSGQLSLALGYIKMHNHSSFTFTGKLTLEECIYLRLILENIKIRKSIRIPLIVLVTFLFIISVITLYKFYFNWPSAGLLTLSALALYFLVIHPKVSAKYHCRKNLKNLLENTADISSDQISVTNKDSGLWMRWKAIYCLLDTPQGVIFMFSPTSIWFFLPNRCFDTQAPKDALFELARSQNTRIKKLA
jgi:hypothetical protein